MSRDDFLENLLRDAMKVFSGYLLISKELESRIVCTASISACSTASKRAGSEKTIIMNVIE